MATFFRDNNIFHRDSNVAATGWCGTIVIVLSVRLARKSKSIHSSPTRDAGATTEFVSEKAPDFCQKFTISH